MHTPVYPLTRSMFIDAGREFDTFHGMWPILRKKLPTRLSKLRTHVCMYFLCIRRFYANTIR